MKMFNTTGSSRAVFYLIATLLVTSLTCFHARAQNDSVIIEAEDTVLMKRHAARFDPRKALLFAAIAPGLGQVYNKKYWKLPLVYGGFAVLAWNIRNTHRSHAAFKEQLFYNIEHGLGEPNDRNPASGYTTLQLRSAVDRTKYRRDFWIIMMGGMYLLQIVDAHVDAHLKEFDLNPNLRVSIEPMVDKHALFGRQTGMSLRFTF
ncbi:MAG TPA: DUF5683 domain-containing protein [Chryseosolibacter sp.]|nr:DUF5683 domain-containing protein [Chryseosolibacter sp.]